MHPTCSTQGGWSQAADRKVEHARALFQHRVCVIFNGHYEDKRWEAQLTLRSVGSMSEVSRRGEKLTDLLDAREVSEPRTSRTRSENHANRPNSQ